MPRRPRTGFDRYFDARMGDAAFASAYTTARGEVDAVDHIVRALDAAREAAAVTKSDLARRVGMKPEVIRRLFTVEGPNPTLETVVKLVHALDCNLVLVPRVASTATGQPISALAPRTRRPAPGPRRKRS